LSTKLASISPRSAPRKGLFIGCDDAYWKVIHPLLDSGKTHPPCKNCSSTRIISPGRP
jgi:hypothetical protein